MSRRVAALALALAGLDGTALAETPASACAAFAAEVAMVGASHGKAEGEASRTAGNALDMMLKPFSAAQLAVPPERPPKPDTTAGSVAFAAGPAGNYRIGVTEPAWVDVIQGGRYLEPAAVGGAGDCAGLRKSLTVALTGNPFVLQFSNIARETLTLTVVPAP